MTRLVVLTSALLFVVGFAALTVHAVAERGVSLASLVSFFVLLLLGVGVIGAMRHPPS
jgi:hypothetical protein